jgi:hypothetical protein
MEVAVKIYFCAMSVAVTLPVVPTFSAIQRATPPDIQALPARGNTESRKAGLGRWPHVVVDFAKAFQFCGRVASAST